MKKNYISPELSVSEAVDVVSTSAYVETEKIGFTSTAPASNSYMGDANDAFFEI